MCMHMHMHMHMHMCTHHPMMAKMFEKTTVIEATGVAHQRREQALERREAELKRREEELRRNGGGKVKNWPRCYPLIYHDIEGEIPDEYQKMVKVCTRPAERRQRQFNHNRGPRREVEMAVGGNASVRRRM